MIKAKGYIGFLKARTFKCSDCHEVKALKFMGRLWIFKNEIIAILCDQCEAKSTGYETPAKEIIESLLDKAEPTKPRWRELD